MTHFCISCKETVSSRQEAILCDGCDRWQHRICGTNISRKDYHAAVRSGNGIDWHCVDCLNMSAGSESTRTQDNISGKCAILYLYITILDYISTLDCLALAKHTVFKKNIIPFCVLDDAEMEVDDELVDIVVSLAKESAAGKPLYLPCP